MTIAFIIALSFFARQIVGIAISGKNYTPLVYNSLSLSTQLPAKTDADYSFKPDDILWDETRAYARYTQEVLRGEFLGANANSFNPYLTQGSFPKDFWYRDRLGPIILAVMTRGLGDSVSNAFIASDFIFPFLIAFSLLVLCRRFFGFTLFFSVMATASIMWLDWNSLLHLRDIFLGQVPDGLTLLRTPYPQFSFLTFTVFILALMNFNSKASRSSLVFLMSSLIINFYMYFYVWTMVIVMMCLYAIANSNIKLAKYLLASKQKYKYMLWLAIIVAIILSFPVWEKLLIGDAGNVFKDSFQRVFGQYTHQPCWHMSFMILPFLVISFCIRTSSWPTRWVWVLFFLSSLIVLNQQVITGKLNQPGHWTGSLIEPVIILFLFDLVFRFLRNNHILRKCISVITIFFIVTIGMQIYYVAWIGAKVAAPYNKLNSSISGVISFMGRSELNSYGFISNDPYLRTVLPAYVIQKPLLPWYNDPLSNNNINSIETALSEQFGKYIGYFPTTISSSRKLRFNRRKVLIVLNRHLMTYSGLLQCQILFENRDFIISTPVQCKD
ncbi:MAG: hypothetical protein NTZ67_08875 [Gammaproteobacteria bacterium]|nr:hypothetical protein [Gammaproteobacteria bacterium]